jgi:transcriptional regulator with XRE-family HTH domain
MGRAITQLRRDAGMTQNALAHGAGLTGKALGNIERGKVEAGWGTLRRIAYALNVELKNLMELAEELAPGRGGTEWRRWSRTARELRRGREL